MDSELGASGSGSNESASSSVRRVRIHKLRPYASVDPAAATGQSQATRDASIQQRIAELIPGIAELPLPESAQLSGAQAAAYIRQGVGMRMQQRTEAAAEELAEYGAIFDMDTPHPLDSTAPPNLEQWTQTLRPQPKRIQLSHYQHEMINYQRMLLRKNIWYYRDRMNVARGPCPLHTLKEAWVQGVIDENTLMWGQGLYDWLPAKNVKLLLPMIRTPEVRFGAWMKRTFALKPALNRIREKRRDQRDPEAASLQVERMR